MSRRPGTVCLLSVFACLLFSTTALAQPRGYQPRACGFDLDGDGKIGESGDDCNICDGVTADPDGDGKNEDLIYVDCGSGTDGSNCGSPNNPCKSIQHAWSTRADGPGDGAEDIICFTGVCSTVENFEIDKSGVASGGDGGNWYHTRSRTGSQVRSFRYPANPTMLVGWDKDNDGRYPPFDTDDTSVLDAKPRSLARAFVFTKRPNYVEFAHFSVKDYGRYSSDDHAGFVSLTSGSSGDLNGIYFHDLALSDVLRGKTASGWHINFSFFPGSSVMHYIALENIRAENSGAWLVRGGVGTRSENVGPIRIQNVSYKVHANSSGFHGIKFWGNTRGVEILDNDMDANPRAWAGADLKTGMAIVSSGCGQDWDVVNNMIRDFRRGFNVNSKSHTGCTSRPTSDMRFSRNVFYNTFGWVGVIPVRLFQNGVEPDGELTCNTNSDMLDVVVTNNFLSSPVGYKGCYVNEEGNNCRKDPGVAVFANNTCHGPISHSEMGVIHIGKVDSHSVHPKNLQENYVVWNNIISGLAKGSNNVRVRPTPPNWSAGNNVYDPDGSWMWGSSTTESLSTWRSSSDSDSDSRTCTPSFESVSNGDFHLKDSDDCARDRGTPLESLISLDIDGGERPSSNWDIGADESGVSGDGSGGSSGGGDGGGGDGGGGGGEDPPRTNLPAPTLREVVPLPD